MNNLILTTERLALREFTERDWQAVHEYASDPELVRYMDWGPNTEKETRDFIRRAMASYREKPRRDHQFAVILKEEDRLIAGCNIHLLDPRHQEASIEYCFNRNHWGKGKKPRYY